MKKIISIILLGGLILSLSACKPKVAPSYLDILSGEATFITETSKKTSLKSYELELDDKKWNFEARNYLLFDLDGNGNKEMIIAEKENKFKLILHTQNNRVYGCLVPVGQLFTLKTDGTFKQLPAQNNGDTKFCKIQSFNKTSFELKELAMFNIKEAKFYIDEKESNQVLVNKFADEFSKKETQQGFIKVK